MLALNLHHLATVQRHYFSNIATEFPNYITIQFKTFILIFIENADSPIKFQLAFGINIFIRNFHTIKIDYFLEIVSIFQTISNINSIAIASY